MYQSEQYFFQRMLRYKYTIVNKEKVSQALNHKVLNKYV